MMEQWQVVLCEVLEDLVSLASRNNVEEADEVYRKVEKLRSLLRTSSHAGGAKCAITRWRRD